MREFLTLLDFFRRQRRRYLLGVGSLLVVGFLQLLIPRLLGLFTDRLLDPPVDTGLLRHYLLLIIGCAVGIACFRYLWRYYILGTAHLLEKYLRDLLFKHLQQLPAAFYLRHKTGELMAHLTNDIHAVRNALGLSVVLLVDAIFLTAMAVFFIFTTVDYRLALLALIPLPLLAISFQKLGEGIYRRFLVVQDSFGAMTQTAQENVNALRLVKAYVLEDMEKTRFARSVAAYTQNNFSLFKIWGLYTPLVLFFSIISFVIVVSFGGIMVMEGKISIGDFVAFNGYLALLAWPMMAAGWVINFAQRGRASMQRINRLLQEETIPSPGRFPSPEPPAAAVTGDLHLRNLTFSYEGTAAAALRELTLSIPRGRITAITGLVGSGKSTLFYLLLRFYEPQQGEVLLGNRPLKSFSLSDWRRRIGYLPQDGFIFADTIAANIAFAHSAATAEEIAEAARLAALDLEIAALPGGYGTAVGERGVTLSGGQQ
ncbi:MAG TPA: ABC transporter ATP-binding protein, partial [Firmicutes bacterium]|nr:ABC transporter ATP-binding protein [Bacillota bacterium]